jgi:hypothetical protein
MKERMKRKNSLLGSLNSLELGRYYLIAMKEVAQAIPIMERETGPSNSGAAVYSKVPCQFATLASNHEFKLSTEQLKQNRLNSS